MAESRYVTWILNHSVKIYHSIRHTKLPLHVYVPQPQVALARPHDVKGQHMSSINSTNWLVEVITRGALASAFYHKSQNRPWKLI